MSKTIRTVIVAAVGLVTLWVYYVIDQILNRLTPDLPLTVNIAWALFMAVVVMFVIWRRLPKEETHG